MKTYDRITVVNPLIQKYLGPYICDSKWSDWLRAWKSAGSPNEWNSLLHNGFDKNFSKGHYEEPQYGPIDRIIFYLNCADGWHDYLAFSEVKEGIRIHPVRTDKGIVELSSREMVNRDAKKAITMLCQCAFKPWTDKHYDWNEHDPYAEMFTSEELLPILMHFFGAQDKNGGLKFYNMGYQNPSLFQSSTLPHIEEQLRKFVLKLIFTILQWQEGSLRSWTTDRLEGEEKQKFETELAKTKARFCKAKVWAVEILASLGEIELLRKCEIGSLRKLQELEPVVVRTLQKVELFNHIGEGKDKRLVKNHQEALKAGSRTAWFLERYYVQKDCRPDEKVSKRLRSRIVRR